MCHLWNLQNEIIDCCGSGNYYHNKKFKDAAETHKLTVTQEGKYGWCRTTLNEEMTNFVESLENYSFDLHRKAPMIAPKAARAPHKMFKYTCPCCGMTFSSQKELHLICADCDEVLEIS